MSSHYKRLGGVQVPIPRYFSIASYTPSFRTPHGQLATSMPLTQSGPLKKLIIAAEFDVSASAGWPELQIIRNATDVVFTPNAPINCMPHLPLCGDRWDLTVRYTSTPHPWDFTEGLIPHFKRGSYVGDMGGFDTSL